MAIVDWPTDRAFKPSAVTPGVDVPKSGWRGAFTGILETVSHGADRLTCIVTLPPCATRADAQKRHAFLSYIASSGDQVRFAPMHLPNAYPAGSIGGTPTVNGAVSAGARSVVLAGVLSRPNLLLYHGFEIDSNADGLADGWSTSLNGTTGTVTPTLGAFTGYLGTQAQRITAAGLGTTSGDSVAVVATNYAAVSAGLSYTLSLQQAVDNACQGALRVDWYDATPTFLSSSFTTVVPAVGAQQRQSATFTSPASAAKAIVRFSISQRSSSTGSVIWTFDGVQLEQAAAASSYSGAATVRAGDFLGVGGNLLQQSYTDATATDAGALTLSLALPVPKAISNGAAVTWAAPTGVWHLDDDGIQFDYSAGAVQGGIAIPFRQVVV